MEKRYIVFAFDALHPRGGWMDVVRVKPGGDICRFASFQDAAKAGQDYVRECHTGNGRYQVIDLQKGEFVGSGGFHTGNNPHS